MLHTRGAHLRRVEFSEKDTERLFQVSPDKIEVIYNALDERFRPGHASEADSRFIAERYQVNSPSCCTPAVSARTTTLCAS